MHKRKSHFQIILLQSFIDLRVESHIDFCMQCDIMTQIT